MNKDLDKFTTLLKSVMDIRKEKTAVQDAIKAEFKTKEEKKPLSTADRLERIERLLGLNK